MPRPVVIFCGVWTAASQQKCTARALPRTVTARACRLTALPRGGMLGGVGGDGVRELPLRLTLARLYLPCTNGLLYNTLTGILRCSQHAHNTRARHPTLAQHVHSAISLLRGGSKRGDGAGGRSNIRIHGAAMEPAVCRPQSHAPLSRGSRCAQCAAPPRAAGARRHNRAARRGRSRCR